MDQRYVKPRELATMLGVHTKTLSRWADEGRMPKPLHIANTVRWRQDEVTRWLDRQSSRGK